MLHSRRQFLIGAAGLAGLAGFTANTGLGQAVSRTRLILLGTKGGPRVSAERNNPSTLLLINGTPYLVDCGYGASRQLVAVGVAAEKLRYIFVTHHHSDHDLEFGPIVYN